MEFHSRLETAMATKGLAPGELARRVGVAPSAVSGWLGGKRPSRKNLGPVADVLGVTAAWLEHGEGSGPELSAEKLSAERQSLIWWMKEQGPEGQRVLGEAASTGFDPTLATITREAAQNIRDARRPGEPTVTANFSFERLRGDKLTGFLEAIHFRELEPHLKAVAEGKGKQARVVALALKKLDGGKGELLILRIEDLDGIGLLGEEYRDSSYSALVRNVMDTVKGDVGAGGSHGLGKSTIQRSSAFGLLLFASNLSEPEPATAKQDRRLVGRITLPWHHRLDTDAEYAGPGWFGIPDHTPKRDGTARSAYVSTHLLDEMRLSRPARTGTSILVVAAHDPSGETSDLAEMAREVSKALAQNFFAALTRQGEMPPIMRAFVRAVDVTSEGHQKVLHDEEVDALVTMRPLVDLLEKARKGLVVDELQTAGDVVMREVELEVPQRLEDPKHERLKHRATLLIRQAADDELGHDFINSVVQMRSALMRVSTLKPRGLGAGVRPYFAVLLAGEAALTDNENLHAERFLRTAEPPSHNSWKVTTDVGIFYQARGVLAMLTRFEGNTLSELKKAVTVPMREPSDGPRSLRELLRIKVPPEPTARPKITGKPLGAPRPDGAWELTEITVQLPPKSKGWTFTPVLKFAAETGAGTTVEWEVTPVEGCERVDGGRLRVAAGVKQAKFSGISDPVSHPIAADDAVVAVDLHRVMETRESS